MSRMRFVATGILAAVFLVCFVAVSTEAGPGLKDPVSKGCLTCHANFKGMKDVLAGNFKSRSNKAKSIQMSINNRMEVVKFTPETKVVNVPNIKALKSPIPIRVHYKRAGDDLVAQKIVAKPEMKVPPGQLMATEELQRLVDLGPEKGGYTLVDSRPAIKYAAGHIPTAVSVPFPKMSQMKGKLPGDKERLLIFYCEGLR